MVNHPPLEVTLAFGADPELGYSLTGTLVGVSVPGLISVEATRWSHNRRLRFPHGIVARLDDISDTLIAEGAIWMLADTAPAVGLGGLATVMMEPGQVAGLLGQVRARGFSIVLETRLTHDAHLADLWDQDHAPTLAELVAAQARAQAIQQDIQQTDA